MIKVTILPVSPATGDLIIIPGPAVNCHMGKPRARPWMPSVPSFWRRRQARP